MRMWTTTEVKLLKLIYETHPREKLLREFYPRSINSIARMANSLGLRRRRDWKAITENYKPVIFDFRDSMGEQDAIQQR